MNDEEKELRQRLLRQASLGGVGGFRPPESPLASWFGDVKVGCVGEEWPTSNDSDDPRAWMPLCQINVTELPYRPELLSDVALVTVFLDTKGLPASNSPNGSGWLLRAYPSLEELIPLPRPAVPRNSWQVRPFPLRWEILSEDFPCWEDVDPLEMSPELDDNYYDLFENQKGTKVGGWPSLIQSSIGWSLPSQQHTRPEYVFQIDSESKAYWQWGDGGVAYFGRGIGADADKWAMTWQCL